MNDAELDREVARVLQELFPEPTSVTLNAAEPHRRTGRTVAVLAAAAAVIVTSAAIAVLHGTSSRNGAGPFSVSLSTSGACLYSARENFPLASNASAITAWPRAVRSGFFSATARIRAKAAACWY